MKQILTLLAISIQIIAYGQENDIFHKFKDPDKDYSIVPFWSWNGNLESKELKRQIDLMMEQGVYGAFMHARSGLNESGKTPYFSDGWWAAVDTTIAYAHRKGFQAWLYDEDKWPSGSAGGRTIARNPAEFVKKGLHYSVIRLQEGDVYKPEKDKLKVFAVKMTKEKTFDARSKVDLTALTQWKAPSDSWQIISFEQVSDRTEYPYAQIDYFDKNAVRAFIDITHEEYYKRYSKYFGNTVPGIFFDEIYYGLKGLPWTDDFADSFKKQTGYDILDELPSLVFQSARSESINYDYFKELTRRYDEAWFGQIAAWCSEHGIGLTGHTNEGFTAYKDEGDYFKTMGSIQFPGTDNEDFRYSFPRYLNWYKPKQLSSLSHIYGRNRSMVEAMGGGGYVITPEEYRYGMARLGVCGINFFVPHLFHYSDNNLESYNDWPPSWFFRNPYWKYFKPLADFGRRISYMNRQGSHVCHVSVLYPLAEQWAGGYAGGADQRDYVALQDILLNNQIDYDVINDEAFLVSDCSGGEIKLHDESYKVLILPSINLITLETAKKIADFYHNGGIVIASGGIPYHSVFGNDNEVNALLYGVFGIKPKQSVNFEVSNETFEPFTSNANARSGNAYYMKNPIHLPSVVRKNIPNEIEVVEGEPAFIRFYQQKKDDVTYYLLMNEVRKAESFQIRTPDYGVPYKMNPETGEISKLENYLTINGELLISLHFQPWEAFYLAFKPEAMEKKSLMISATSLIDAKINNQVLTGWANSDTSPYAVIQYTNGAKQEYRPPVDQSLKPVTLDGVWKFQVVNHALDQKWADHVQADTIDLSVMKFYAEYDSKPRNINVSEFDDQHLPEIKIIDRFSNTRGAVRYLDTWNASRIVYYDKNDQFMRAAFMGRNVSFRKIFNLNGTPAVANLRITADPSFILYVNESKVGEGKKSQDAGYYDIKPFLKKGNNEIRVEVPAQKGLIAEGNIETDSAVIRLNTDDSWEAQADEIWETALIVGKPLPVDYFTNNKIRFPLTCLYQSELPVGATQLILPERKGTFTYYADGNLLKEQNGRIRLPANQNHRPIKFAVKAVLQSAKDGLLAPIRVICEETDTQLAPWKELGLNGFTGRAIYTKEFTLPKGFQEKEVKTILDLGEVKWFAEVWINGQLVKYFPWGDFKTDVTPCLKKGKNKITVIISNLRANEAFNAVPDALMEDPYNRWWQQGVTLREKDRLESGLTGPVRFVPIKYIELKLED